MNSDASRWLGGAVFLLATVSLALAEGCAGSGVSAHAASGTHDTAPPDASAASPVVTPSASTEAPPTAPSPSTAPSPDTAPPTISSPEMVAALASCDENFAETICVAPEKGSCKCYDGCSRRCLECESRCKTKCVTCAKKCDPEDTECGELCAAESAACPADCVVPAADCAVACVSKLGCT